MTKTLGEEFYEMFGDDLQTATNCFCSYGRGFLIFYKDANLKHTVIQFKIDEMLAEFNPEKKDWTETEIFVKQAVIMTRWEFMRVG